MHFGRFYDNSWEECLENLWEYAPVSVYLIGKEFDEMKWEIQKKGIK